MKKNDYCYLISYAGYKDGKLINSADNFYFDCEWSPEHLENFIDHMIRTEGYSSATPTFIFNVGRYADPTK